MTTHLDIPTRAQLVRLVRDRRPGCVSIYVPTRPDGQQADAERIELGNRAGEAVDQLRATDMDKADVAAIERALSDVVDDEAFWRYQANTLAVFADRDGVSTFRLPNRLTPAVEVSDRFHVKPLLRTFAFPQAAFVLALAQGSVRVVEVAPDVPPEPLEVPDLPSGVDDAAGASSGQARAGERRLQGSDDQTRRLRQYARQIDRALRPALGGHDAPLVLAGTEPLVSIYRSVSSHPLLVDAVIAGNPETTSDAELADAVRPVLDELYDRELQELRDRFEERRAQDRAVADLADVARAATFGAVDTLLVDIDEVVPGEIDEASGEIVLDDADDAVNYGITDEVARRVLLSSGRVVAVRRDDVPGGGPTAAILRHPLI